MGPIAFVLIMTRVKYESQVNWIFLNVYFQVQSSNIISLLYQTVAKSCEKKCEI